MTVPGGWRSSRKSAMILAKLPGGKSAKSGIRRKTVARESITIVYLPRRGTSGKHERWGGRCPPYSPRRSMKSVSFLTGTLLLFLIEVSAFAERHTTVTLLHFSDYHPYAVPFYSEGQTNSAGIARAIAYLKPLAVVSASRFHLARFEKRSCAQRSPTKTAFWS